MEGMSDLALLERDGRVARLTLNRPDARNALSLDLLSALRDRVEELRGDEETTVCVVAGAGRAFCAGMDLKQVIDDPQAPGRLLSTLAELTLEVRALEQVTIAAVNRAAIGGGCGLASVCDIAITHADAKLGFPEVDLGVCPAVVAPWLVRRVGAGRARRILLQGGTLTGERALADGLVDQAVATQEELGEAVEQATGRIASAGPAALRATKRWLGELDGEELAGRVRRGAEISAEVLASDEARAAVREAFAKRK